MIECFYPERTRGSTAPATGRAPPRRPAQHNAAVLRRHLPSRIAWLIDGHSSAPCFDSSLTDSVLTVMAHIDSPAAAGNRRRHGWCRAGKKTKSEEQSDRDHRLGVGDSRCRTRSHDLDSGPANRGRRHPGPELEGHTMRLVRRASHRLELRRARPERAARPPLWQGLVRRRSPLPAVVRGPLPLTGKWARRLTGMYLRSWPRQLAPGQSRPASDL